MPDKKIVIYVSEDIGFGMFKKYYNFSIEVNNELTYEGGPNTKETTEQIINNAVASILSEIPNK